MKLPGMQTTDNMYWFSHI